MGKNYVPVLLIGLGGIGSAIVDETYGKLIKDKEFKSIQALAFDTDQGDLSKLKNIPKDCQIQTSDDKTVKYALEKDKNAIEWFPVHPKIETMPLINGAGQIRAVSRLALRAAMKSGKLNKIQGVKDTLNKLGGNAAEKGVRIMIVSSMMGGTGSGMFLSIPLYLREILQNKFSADRIEIQGVFLLPDVLQGSIDPKEKTNVYANAYASMKELYAISMSLSDKTAPTVNLEYKPDQIDTTGDISVKDWPYDYCFVYDKEDSKGRVLATLEDYKHLVSDNLHSQVYGPISDAMYSHFINEIRNIIRNNCENIFGGLGIGKLIYPYDDICEYITCRAISENLKEQLLRIDESYKNKLEQYEKNKQAGMDAVKPELSLHYMDEFDVLREDNTNMFFKQVNKQITDFDENGEKVSDKIDEYLDYLEDLFEKQATDFFDKNEFKQLKKSDVEKAVEGQLKSIINNNEAILRDCRRMIDSKIANEAEMYANNDFGYFEDNKENNFDKYFKCKEGYINPVGIRYILYNFEFELKGMKNEATEAKEKIKTELQNKETTKLKDTFKNKTSLTQALEHAIASDKNPADKFMFKTMKKFKDEYNDEAQKHYNKLMEYAKVVFKESYCRKTLEFIDGLIKEYENMFNKLDEQKVGIEKKIEELAIKHDDNLGKIDMFVLASKSFKEKIWESIPLMTRLNVMSTVLPEKMHKNLLVNCKQKLKNQTVNVVGYDYLFNTLIMQDCKESLQNDKTINEMLDINIVRAIMKEYEFNKGNMSEAKSDRTYIRERLQQIIDRTQPFTNDSENATNYHIWGLNDDLRLATESANDKPMIKELIGEASDNAANGVCEDSIYSKYEIIYLHSRYGLKVSDFTKFHADEKGIDDGEYYGCYYRFIKGIVDEGSIGIGRNVEITPHIDKRWHKTLLDPNSWLNDKKKDDCAKAVIFGLPLKWITSIVKKFGEDKTKLEFKKKSSQNTPLSIKVNGKELSGNLATLYDNIHFDPDLVEDINIRIKEHCKKEEDERANDYDSNKKALDKDDIITSICNTGLNGYDDVKNILDLIVKLYEEIGNKTSEERAKALQDIFDGLFDTIEKVVSSHLGEDKDVVSEGAKSILKNILKNSNLVKGIDEESEEYMSVVEPIKNKIKKYEEK